MANVKSTRVRTSLTLFKWGVTDINWILRTFAPFYRKESTINDQYDDKINQTDYSGADSEDADQHKTSSHVAARNDAHHDRPDGVGTRRSYNWRNLVRTLWRQPHRDGNSKGGSGDGSLIHGTVWDLCELLTNCELTGEFPMSPNSFRTRPLSPLYSYCRLFGWVEKQKRTEIFGRFNLLPYLCSGQIQIKGYMTTIELRTSIAAELDQMSVEMLESVSRYVKRLAIIPVPPN